MICVALSIVFLFILAVAAIAEHEMIAERNRHEEEMERIRQTNGESR